MQIIIKLALSLLLIATFPYPAWADVELSVSVDSNQVEGSMDIGKVFVEGTGEVSLVVSKNGQRLVVHARNPAGEVIGRAETVAGLTQTPVYVKTADGLSKITIFWDR